MRLSRLLNLQLLYCGLGILFNLISWYIISKNGKPLTPTEPVVGMVVMGIYGLFLLAGKTKRIVLYRGLMLLAVLILGYGGILKHIITLQQSPELYASISIGLLAILINTFGLGLNILAALGRFIFDET